VEFAFFAVVGLIATSASALMIVVRKPVHSALLLVVTLFCVAVLYLSLAGEFLAAVQVFVYAGAIMVLFLFVITLLNPVGEDALAGSRRLAVVAVAAGAALLALLVAGITAGVTALGIPNHPPPAITWGDNIQAVGKVLFTDYLFLFEATSLLLLIALVGASALAKGQLRRAGRRQQ
jgi:NADH-quinone oxidoreductase subunit J